MSASAAGAFERRDVDGIRTLFVRGELDIDNASEFGEQLTQAMAESHSPTMVDLSGVEFIDSSGINALIEAQRTAPSHGTELVLVAPSTSCRRVFEILGMTTQFTITDS